MYKVIKDLGKNEKLKSQSAFNHGEHNSEEKRENSQKYPVHECQGCQ